MDSILVAIITAAGAGFTAYLVAVIQHRREMTALAVEQADKRADNKLDQARLQEEIRTALFAELRIEIENERARRREDRADFEQQIGELKMQLKAERDGREQIESRLRLVESENAQLRAELARYGSNRL